MGSMRGSASGVRATSGGGFAGGPSVAKPDGGAPPDSLGPDEARGGPAQPASRAPARITAPAMAAPPDWRGWRGSNPLPLASEANTLSTELQPRLGRRGILSAGVSRPWRALAGEAGAAEGAAIIFGFCPPADRAERTPCHRGSHERFP